MSAYICEDKTINRIVTYLQNSDDMGYARERVLGKLGYTGKFAGELGRAMFELNCQSIEERYGKGQAKEFRSLDYKYKPVPLISAIQVYKSLLCYLYQSCEGKCDKTELYTALDEISNLMAAEIVRGLPAYEQAIWG